MDYDNLGTYKKMLDRMFLFVGKAIGIHVMLLVVEHALWKTRQRYEEAALIHYSEDGVVFERLDQLEPEKAKLVAYDFVMSIFATLSRLVGSQLACQLTEQLQKDVLGGEE